MRKTMIIAVMCATALSVTACGDRTSTVATTAIADAGTENGTEAEGTEPEETTGAAETPETAAGVEPNQTALVTAPSQTSEPASESRVLVAYFSRAENIGGVPSVDAVSSASINMHDGEVVGNMRAMAGVIQELTGGDLFSIQTERTYSQNYRESTNEAREELNSNARPALTTHVEDMSQYDVIYLGYPNWWGTIPTAVSTFLEEYDFSGKTIIPFCSHEGSGLGSGVAEIQQLCPDAELLEGYAVRGSQAEDTKTRDEIAAWLQEIGQQ